jgi:hypothetical protein
LVVLAGSAKELAKLAYGQAVSRPHTLGQKLQALDHATHAFIVINMYREKMCKPAT